MRSVLSLARWLGPLGGTRLPQNVQRTETKLHTERRPLRIARYEPLDRTVRGSFLLAPGIHYQGPDDPRFDRFARVLAHAGFLVEAPFLNDHLALQIAPSATDELALAFDHLEEESAQRRLQPKPAIFSISFGSQPALSLSARSSHAERVGAVVLFGGFADFTSTVRFCVTGRATHEGKALDLPHDPLNAPVVWLHLLHDIPGNFDRNLVATAWRTMVYRTWGRMELKRPGARDFIADAIAEELPPTERAVFLLGCGLGTELDVVLQLALNNAGDRFAFADVRPQLAQLRAPVVMVHGRDDDVIPWNQALLLQQALPPGHPHRLLLTGMYGHTGSALPSLGALARELQTMGQLLSTVVDAATDPSRISG